MTCVDNNTEDQVWLELRCAPQVVFGFCYIPPSDSPYYSNYSFAVLQEKLSDVESCKKFLFIGDTNARFGVSVCDLLSRVEAPGCHMSCYPTIPDDARNPNDIAYILSTVCENNNLLVLNIPTGIRAWCSPRREHFGHVFIYFSQH